MAKETLYLKIDGNVLVHQKNLTIKDIAQITCSNTSLKNRIQVLKLKDFHLTRPGRYVKSVVEVLDMIHAEYPEVEVENLDMVKEAVEAGADIIMLDNMSTEEMQEAIRIIDGRAETECSGNVTKENIGRLTALGVDYISSGALTHSAPILDISLKHLHAVL